MAKRTRIALIVAICGLVFLVAWMINHSGTSRVGENTLRVGAVLPLTGDLAAYGNNSKDGIELAEQELNDRAAHAGGLNVQLFVEDSKGEPQTAVSALLKLITVDHISCVIGDVGSSPTLAMAPIANQSKIVLFSPAASSPNISKAGDYVFRDWPSDDFEASGMAQYVKTKGYRKIGVLLVNNDYGQAMLKSFSERIQPFGGAITDTETFQQNATDLRTQLTKLQASNPDVLYLISYPKDTIVFLRQYAELGTKIPIISTSSFEDPQILKLQGRVTEGVVFTSPVPPDQTDPIVDRFRESYAKKYGKGPGLVADYAYDALRVLAEAARLSGGTSGEKLRNGLQLVKDFHGASGIINFDSNGDVLKPVGLKTVKDNQFVWLSSQSLK